MVLILRNTLHTKDDKMTTDVKKKDDDKKRPTRPGWRPSGKLSVLKARKGFTARWVSNDAAEIAKKKAEGWLIMRPEDNVGTKIQQEDVNDGSALIDGIVYRDLIAMMLPDDVKQDREDYFREENKQAIAGVLRQSDAELANTGVQTYTPKGQDGRIVIE